jgi:hypothetical protein
MDRMIGEHVGRTPENAEANVNMGQLWGGGQS